MKRTILAILGLMALALPASATDFAAPVQITTGQEFFQLSRTTSKVMLSDGYGYVQLVYWSGEASTTLSTPSMVYFREWIPGAGWQPAEVIDDSFIGQDRIGGRQPSMARAADGTLWVTWHDHRHSTAGANFIDNVEIYADSKTPGGSFSSSDLRLTASSSGNAGDNGYLPQIVGNGDGSLSVVWYDFNADDTSDETDASDIYLKQSDTSGSFNLSETMASMRYTFKEDRGGEPAFSTPDIVVTPDGTTHLVWSTDFTIVGGDLYYASLAPGGSNITPQLVEAGVSSYFDPPRLIPGNGGDVWVVYTDSSDPNDREVTLRRLRSGQSSFDAPIVPDPQPGRQTQPSAVADDAQQLHLAWVDEDDSRSVYYGRFDIDTSTLVEKKKVSTQGSVNRRTAITQLPDGQPVIVYEESVGSDSSQLVFVGPPALAAGDTWSVYQ